MRRFTNVIYDEEPDNINILGKSVDVIIDKRQIEEIQPNGTVVIKWEADVERYESIEFARKAVKEGGDYALAGNILLGLESC